MLSTASVFLEKNPKVLIKFIITSREAIRVSHLKSFKKLWFPTKDLKYICDMQLIMHSQPIGLGWHC